VQYKIRILNFKGKEKNFSITIPKDIITLVGSETKFFIEYNSIEKKIVLTSGASIFPTAEEINNFDLESCRI